jgi:hypothetical protein
MNFMKSYLLCSSPQSLLRNHHIPGQKAKSRRTESGLVFLPSSPLALLEEPRPLAVHLGLDRLEMLGFEVPEPPLELEEKERLSLSARSIEDE